ncbi:MAG: hypothetical protein V5A68_02165 [Candidatus Thermoplasmatota archaeon]
MTMFAIPTIYDLNSFWNKMIPCGTVNCPTDTFVEKPVYDRNHSRVGTFFTWFETDCRYQHYELFVDPFLRKK